MAGSTAKNRKFGRFKLKCAAYRNEQRREKNKKRKLARHLVMHGNDRQALHAFTNIKISPRFAQVSEANGSN